MTEMLWKKEDLYEVDWVKEQTKSALSSLQKEVLYTKNGDEVKFDVDTSLDYLKTLKDKKTYKEVMEKNSWATIMAVQILLKNRWFNVWKIDWILKSPWKTTSTTMKSIKAFQRKNWLEDDGLPGPNTIRKLLEVNTDIYLTEEEFHNLCEKTSMTDEEFSKYIKFIEATPRVPSLKLIKITDEQAKELSKFPILVLYAEEITNEQAKILSNIEELQLYWLKKISDEQAMELAKVKYLTINKDILTPKQKEILKKHIS